MFFSVPLICEIVHSHQLEVGLRVFTYVVCLISGEETVSEKAAPEKEKKRERSSSRTRKKDGEEDKAKRKSAKTKKKSDPELSKEEMEKVLEEARKLSEIIAQAPVVENKTPVDEVKSLELNSNEPPKIGEQFSIAQPADESIESHKEKLKEVKKVKKVKSDKETAKKNVDKNDISPTKPKLKKEKEVDIPDKDADEKKVKTESEAARAEPTTKETSTPPLKETEPTSRTPEEEVPETKETGIPFRRDSVRRKSKVFETAELFSKTASQDKIPQKKVFLPGVKVGFVCFYLYMSFLLNFYLIMESFRV